MTNLKPLIIILIILMGCASSETDKMEERSTIKIGNYVFDFPSNFTLQELQGIDSYVGTINGPGISLSFDYGWYTSPVFNLPENDYLVIEDEINGHYRQIIKPVDSETNYTRIHLFKISDSIENPDSYNSLSINTHDLNSAEQEMIIEIFKNVEIAE